MLKKRSKPVSSKQGVVMSQSISLASLTGNLTHKPPTSSSLFPSFKNPFLSFCPKRISEHDSSVKLPNSISDFKPFSSICNPFFSDRKARAFINKSSDGKDCKPVGLAIVDALTSEKSSMAVNKLVETSSLIKVQVPLQTEPRLCPIEFGVKNKESQLAMALLSPGQKPSLVSTIPTMDHNSPRGLCLSASEIEQSEDYTCVISHGPQKKKTHIFDNIIIESCGDGFSSLGKIRLPSDQFGGYNSDCFLTFCHGCRKGDDLFIYREEKAFCSQECLNREIICEEERDHS